MATIDNGPWGLGYLISHNKNKVPVVFRGGLAHCETFLHRVEQRLKALKIDVERQARLGDWVITEDPPLSGQYAVGDFNYSEDAPLLKRELA